MVYDLIIFLIQVLLIFKYVKNTKKQICIYCNIHASTETVNNRVHKSNDDLLLGVSLYCTRFLYSGECSFHNQTVYTNSSCIPSYRKFFHEKPSERYHQARVFMLRETGTNEL